MTLVYDRTIAEHVEPIEKKPLFHFYPGAMAASIATVGCNFRCEWCQNWEMALGPRLGHMPQGGRASPEAIVSRAVATGCQTIAYTYTEPTVFFELAYDTARLAHQRHLSNVFVTNGYMTREALETLQPHLDAANVDLKSFRDATYRKCVGGRLQPVLDSMKTMKRMRIWLEVSTLVIPGVNNDPAELTDIATFIARELGRDTPWHVSRFFPAHKLIGVPMTPPATLRRAREIGLEAGLHHVYVGNVPDEQNTYCQHCGRPVIRRLAYRVVENTVSDDQRCPYCGSPIAGQGLHGAIVKDTITS